MSVEEVRNQIIQKAWEDEQFKARLLEDPRSTIEEMFGYSLPWDIEITVVEETNKHYYIVIPPNPADTTEEASVMVTPWN
ncbi:NHLP leader peptide family RiPP precursor [Paenibacillus thailandensis]|uniref:NHLP leader peptide family RiPP n=1 Tax=Paenibacillus thailandensis TaxID=393250 RepID=A0ABW5QVQ3_9BACL